MAEAYTHIFTCGSCKQTIAARLSRPQFEEFEQSLKTAWSFLPEDRRLPMEEYLNEAGFQFTVQHPCPKDQVMLRGKFYPRNKLFNDIEPYENLKEFFS